MPRKPSPERFAAIYARASSTSQDTRSQEPDLKRWADTQGGDAAWYRDQFSGKTMARPGWDRLWADVLAGRVTTIVAWRIDRLGRTARGLSGLFAELIERGVNLVLIREGLDLATPAGRLMAHVMGGVAQYETEVRSERQRAGIGVAKAAGVKFGRPAGAGKKIKVTAEQERAARRLKAEGQAVAAIARTLGLSRPTVYSLLLEG